METIKLSKALQVKNLFVNEISELYIKLASNNSHLLGNKPNYNSDELLIEIKDKIALLIGLKQAIYTANAPIYRSILKIAELKGMLVHFRGIDTTAGIIRSFRDEEPVKRIAQISEVELDEMKKELIKDISNLQDEIDEFNHTHKIEY